jgi:hypothetical protein
MDLFHAERNNDSYFEMTSEEDESMYYNCLLFLVQFLINGSDEFLYCLPLKPCTTHIFFNQCHHVHM